MTKFKLKHRIPRAKSPALPVVFARVPPKLKSRLIRMSIKSGVSQSDFVVQALTYVLNELEDKPIVTKR